MMIKKLNKPFNPTNKFPFQPQDYQMMSSLLMLPEIGQLHYQRVGVNAWEWVKVGTFKNEKLNIKMFGNIG